MSPDMVWTFLAAAGLFAGSLLAFRWAFRSFAARKARRELLRTPTPVAPPPYRTDYWNCLDVTLQGEVVVRGTNIPAREVAEMAVSGMNWDDVLAAHPGLRLVDVEACLRFVASTHT